jgi:hypothetical protein
VTRPPSLLFALTPLAALAALTALAAACGSSDGEAAPVVADADGAATTDGGTDAVPVDNGSPSSIYPAPHPPLPQLVNAANGPILTTPKIVFVLYPGDPHKADLETFANKMVGSAYWTATTAEYGVGPLTYGGAIELTGETPPTTIAQTEIQTYVSNALASGKLGTPDPQAIYTLVYPSSTTVTQLNPVTNLLPPVKSCESFSAYHDSVLADAGDAGAKTRFAFAVIPTCASPIDSLTEPITHEWVEAATDPAPTFPKGGVILPSGGPEAAFFSTDKDHTVWALLGGAEAADLCNTNGSSVVFTPPEIGFAVQRSWSNIAAKASHDPCVPHVNGIAYFAAAPVLDQTVTFDTSFTGSVTSKGVVIPLGQSRTIEVDLFSDGALDGPITVAAKDLLNAYYGAQGIGKTLDFTWDRTQGVNGEKLHLTVTVTDGSFFGGAHAFFITASRGSRRQVWPGLVVEQ